ncbi:Zinc-type alcohol dehydrogenase-like protein [Maioricimonas rarisocia]|uniref:Zinc-type alcohol dehydrogenase-like protein n=1 Tax=Maioricimonas rarisocia TaxID=2528026 RepID=A0A517Z799_9PLAN|nr:NAD(P)-dependent alcohol dehydrogenase [Maioricimonas rarisocia]QDU38355.1 Zinc-type alcohol dehydrogenase-like protein [Maioricimonas rarisocia]
MKAFAARSYGPPEVLQLREVDTPVPKDNEVLIRIHATTVSSGDWRVRSLNVPTGFGIIVRLVFGFTRPRQPILGTELSGVVEAIGKDVTRFNAGDEVFAFSDATMGAHAEFITMPAEGVIAPKPDGLGFDEAAALSFGGVTALQFLQRAKLEQGEKVLVNGASGAVGTAAVQIARHFGAEVTGVCSTGNVELVRSLGADRVIDYTQESVVDCGETFDVVMDTVGTLPFAKAKKLLPPGGRLLQIVGSLPQAIKAPWLSLTSGRKVIGGAAMGRREDLEFLAKLAGSGEYRPVIDRRYPFAEMIEAHRYVDQGHKKGNVVVIVNGEVE